MLLRMVGLFFALIIRIGNAEIYKCPDGSPPPKLTTGQTVQRNGQVKCSKASGFSKFRCTGNQISGTYYNVPNESNPGGWSGYKTFLNCLDTNSSVRHTVRNGQSVLLCRPPKAKDSPPHCCYPLASTGAVNVQGSGITKNGSVVEYNRHIHPNQCPKIFDSLTVMAGGSHKCLIPFISVACDVTLYPYGTIFSIPLLKDVVIKMSPDGQKTMKHPGYVICEDTGSAITGPGRFDFYTGPFANIKSNIFSNASVGDPKLRMNIKDCRSDKSFSPIKRDSPKWVEAHDQIVSATRPGLDHANKLQQWFSETSR
jgi:hypothetical protein